MREEDKRPSAYVVNRHYSDAPAELQVRSEARITKHHSSPPLVAKESDKTHNYPTLEIMKKIVRKGLKTVSFIRPKKKDDRYKHVVGPKTEALLLDMGISPPSWPEEMQKTRSRFSRTRRLSSVVSQK